MAHEENANYAAEQHTQVMWCLQYTGVFTMYKNYAWYIMSLIIQQSYYNALCGFEKYFSVLAGWLPDVVGVYKERRWESVIPERKFGLKSFYWTSILRFYSHCNI